LHVNRPDPVNINVILSNATLGAMNDDTQNRASNIGTQVGAMFLALVVGGIVAIVTVLVFANLFQPYKEMMPVAFVCGAILGSVCGLGLRRSMLASYETKHDDEST